MNDLFLTISIRLLHCKNIYIQFYLAFRVIGPEQKILHINKDQSTDTAEHNQLLLCYLYLQKI